MTNEIDEVEGRPRALEVRFCHECRYVVSVQNINHGCELNGLTICTKADEPRFIPPYLLGVPDWCPLPRLPVAPEGEVSDA